jgi:outer membrane protein assembly factor BamB
MPSTERMPDPFDVFLSSPVVSGNTVIFGSGDQTVYALDAVTGKLKWSFATGDVVHASPAVANGVVYIGSWDRNLYAIDLASGREKWRYVTGNDTTIYNQIGIASSAAVSGGRVFVGGRDGHFHAVDEKTGKLAWTIDNRGGWTIASPACGTASSTSRPPTALASRRSMPPPAKSSSTWRTRPSASRHRRWSGRWRSTEPRMAGSMRPTRRPAPLSPSSRPTGRRRTAQIHRREGPNQDQLLYPDRTLDGMMIGMRTMQTLGSILSSPVVVDGVVYFGSTDGNLYAVR